MPRKKKVAQETEETEQLAEDIEKGAEPDNVENEFDHPEDREGEVEMAKAFAMDDIVAEPESPEEGKPEEDKQEAPEEKAEADTGDDQPEEPSAEVESEEEVPDKPVEEAPVAEDVIAEEDVKRVMQATGWPEFVAKRLSPAEARDAIVSAYLPKQTQPAPTAPVAEPKVETETKPVDLADYGFNKDDWDETQWAQMQSVVGKLRDDSRKEVGEVKTGFAYSQEQTAARLQEQAQRESEQYFDRWIDGQKNPGLYGEGGARSMPQSDPKFKARQDVASMAGAMYRGFQQQHGPEAQLPPPEQFFEWAENAVHFNAKQTNGSAVATLEEQQGQVTARPSHRGAKPVGKQADEEPIFPGRPQGREIERDPDELLDPTMEY